MAPLRALVVDDSSFMRCRVTESLNELGIAVSGEAGDVQAAMDAFESLRPDLVVMDMVMPGGSGLDLLKFIISKDAGANVVVLTSLAQDRLDQEFSRLGARAVVSKPFTDEDMKTAVQSVFPDHSQPSSPAAEEAGPPARTASADQLDALEAFFQGVAARSAADMSKWCKSAWELDSVTFRVASRQPFDDCLQRLLLAKAVSVQITVRQAVKIVGLALIPLSSVENVAAALSRKEREGLPEAEINNILTEWANVIITSSVNLFANKMKTILLSSAPKVLALNAEEILAQIPKDLSEAPENLLAVHSQYSSGGLATSCETMFFLRPDCLPPGRA